MSIYKVNRELSAADKIDLLNQMILELNGKVEQGKFDKNELDYLFGLSGYTRAYSRDVLLGNTISDYTDWTHVKQETGYSIWKIAPTSYSYNSVNKVYFDDILVENRGSADSESATSFDYVFLYNGDSGSGFVDNTTEAATETGTEFEVMDSSNDYLYVGEASTFLGIKFEWATRGSGYALKVEYWNGSAWTELTANDNNLADDTSNFESDGRISWDDPGDWATTSVNSQTKYWIRISTTEEPTTTAEAYYIIPGNSVIALLALSSTEFLNEEWAWCYYNSNIYVTIRNTGQSAYEGDYYITSSSSAANLQNFFVFNHAYKSDYELA